MVAAYLVGMDKPQPILPTVLRRRSSVLPAAVVTALSSSSGCAHGVWVQADRPTTDIPLKETTMKTNATVLARNANATVLTRDELVARLIRAGELEVLGGDQAETDSYFDTSNFRFHAPDGFETDYAGLTRYFKSIRAAFDDRSIRRGIIIAEGDHIACQTWIEGTFAREFALSPAGALPPNGQRVVWDLINIFRFDDQGRLVEEWVRTDYRSFLRQLGAPGQ
jgi:predicted ester cyclase